MIYGHFLLIRIKQSIYECQTEWTLLKNNKTDALSNLQGFFSNLAHNMEEIESKNLLPNQMRLLGEAAYRDPGTYGHSAAFLHAVRNYRPSKNIRTLVEYEPGK